jgi:uncharacterized membrane protein YbhN (UPF0104 family)
VRFVKPLLFVAGAVLLVVLVHRVGTEPILNTLRALRWWQFALICLPYAVIIAVDTLGWRYAFARDRAGFWRLYGARLAGEALNLVTALGSVGGEAVKAWLVRRDVSYAESVPSIVIAKTTITIAQAIFLLIGIVLAWTTLDLTGQILSGMVWLLIVEILAVGGFFTAQVVGLVARGGRMLRWFGVVSDVSAAEELDGALRRYYRVQWRRFALSTAFHTVGWLLGALEAWAILWMLGVTPSLVTATVIEALGSGVRFASFMVPASLGAFEGANAAAFGALGFGASAGLAFSFVRRARQAVWIAIGVVVLAAMRWRDARTPSPPARPRRRSAPSAPRSRRAGREAAAPDA